jgi:pimeloyl-ACP methyl ester carboxylesterase
MAAYEDIDLLPIVLAVRRSFFFSAGSAIEGRGESAKASSKGVFLRIDEIFTCTKKAEFNGMLVMLPGLICDASYYAPQIAAFADSHAVAGYGLRDSLPAMAESVLDEAPERFDLFGHSMGGRVALEVFRKAPERVRRLALVSTGVHSLREGEREHREALKAIGHDEGYEALVDEWLPAMIGPAQRHDPAIADPLKAMCMRAGQEVFDAQIKALLGRPEQESLLPQIDCPTLVMTGRDDHWSGPAQHEAIAEAIADSELVIVEGAGHMVQFEAPEAVNDAISSWLAMPAHD